MESVELKQKLELLQRELARKKLKLEKYERRRNAKDHVRQKITEQTDSHSNTAGNSPCSSALTKDSELVQSRRRTSFDQDALENPQKSCVLFKLTPTNLTDTGSDERTEQADGVASSGVAEYSKDEEKCVGLDLPTVPDPVVAVMTSDLRPLANRSVTSELNSEDISVCSDSLPLISEVDLMALNRISEVRNEGNHVKNAESGSDIILSNAEATLKMAAFSKIAEIRDINFDESNSAGNSAGISSFSKCSDASRDRNRQNKNRNSGSVTSDDQRDSQNLTEEKRVSFLKKADCSQLKDLHSTEFQSTEIVEKFSCGTNKTDPENVEHDLIPVKKPRICHTESNSSQDFPIRSESGGNGAVIDDDVDSQVKCFYVQGQKAQGHDLSGDQHFFCGNVNVDNGSGENSNGLSFCRNVLSKNVPMQSVSNSADVDKGFFSCPANIDNNNQGNKDNGDHKSRSKARRQPATAQNSNESIEVNSSSSFLPALLNCPSFLPPISTDSSFAGSCATGSFVVSSAVESSDSSNASAGRIVRRSGRITKPPINSRQSFQNDELVCLKKAFRALRCTVQKKFAVIEDFELPAICGKNEARLKIDSFANFNDVPKTKEDILSGDVVLPASLHPNPFVSNNFHLESPASDLKFESSFVSDSEPRLSNKNLGKIVREFVRDSPDAKEPEASEINSTPTLQTDNERHEITTNDASLHPVKPPECNPDRRNFTRKQVDPDITFQGVDVHKSVPLGAPLFPIIQIENKIEWDIKIQHITTIKPEISEVLIVENPWNLMDHDAATIEITCCESGSIVGYSQVLGNTNWERIPRWSAEPNLSLIFARTLRRNADERVALVATASSSETCLDIVKLDPKNPQRLALDRYPRCLTRKRFHLCCLSTQNLCVATLSDDERDEWTVRQHSFDLARNLVATKSPSEGRIRRLSCLAAISKENCFCAINAQELFVWHFGTGSLLVKSRLNPSICPLVYHENGLLFLPCLLDADNYGCLVAFNPMTAKSCVLQTYESTKINGEKFTKYESAGLDDELLYGITDRGTLLVWSLLSGALVARSRSGIRINSATFIKRRTLAIVTNNNVIVITLLSNTSPLTNEN